MGSSVAVPCFLVVSATGVFFLVQLWPPSCQNSSSVLKFSYSRQMATDAADYSV